MQRAFIVISGHLPNRTYAAQGYAEADRLMPSAVLVAGAAAGTAGTAVTAVTAGAYLGHRALTDSAHPDAGR